MTRDLIWWGADHVTRAAGHVTAGHVVTSRHEKEGRSLEEERVRETSGESCCREGAGTGQTLHNRARGDLARCISIKQLVNQSVN